MDRFWIKLALTMFVFLLHVAAIWVWAAWWAAVANTPYVWPVCYTCAVATALLFAAGGVCLEETAKEARIANQDEVIRHSNFASCKKRCILSTDELRRARQVINAELVRRSQA